MKRICASFLAIVMLFATYGYASAVNVTSSRASLTLSRYFAEALTGSGRGEIIISYDVKSSKIATSVGVESIVFYTEDGDYVITSSIKALASNLLISIIGFGSFFAQNCKK